MIRYVFGGEGWEEKGMGEGVFEEYEDLRDEGDEILGY